MKASDHGGSTEDVGGVVKEVVSLLTLRNVGYRTWDCHVGITTSILSTWSWYIFLKTLFIIEKGEKA